MKSFPLRGLLPAAAAVLLLLPACCFGQEIVVRAARPGGVYAIGEKILWHISVAGDGAAGVEKVGYVLKKGGLTEFGRGELTLTGPDHAADLETALDAPGSVLAELTAAGPAGTAPIKNLAGALVAPDKLQPSAPPPADFDAFWKAKVAELAAVPVHPVLEKGESGSDAVDYWKITLDNIRGTKVRGQLARPKKGEKLPALLVVQWAGIYPLAKNWATDRAREGWLTLNINAHDLPIDQPAEYYKQQTAVPLDYPAVGNEDKDTSYFLRMYLSCYRAAEYLTHRPDWDGRTLVVMGTSQGGLQALMTGGLYPNVTAVLANVPAGCDQTGPLVGRAPGWPGWYYQTKGKDAARVIAASRYYDVVNFARHITCPALVALGLIDQTCPPAGVAVAFDQLRGPKELVVMERSDHQGHNNSQAAFYARSTAWLQRLVKGEPPPVAAPSSAGVAAAGQQRR